MGNTVNEILAKAQRKKSRKTPTRLATHPVRLDFLHVKRITTNGRKKGYQQTQQSHVRSSRRSWRHEWPRQVLLTSLAWYLATLSIVSFLLSSTAVSLRLLPPPFPRIPLGTTHSGCVTFSTKIRFILVQLNHEPLDCFENPPVPLARIRGCNG